MSFFIADAQAEGDVPAASAAPATTVTTTTVGQPAAATNPRQQSPMETYGSFIMIGVMLVMFYFLLIRPQQKRAKEHKSLMESLSKGNEVAINGGLTGRIMDVGENFVLLEVANGVNIKVQKNAISMVLPKGSLKGL